MLISTINVLIYLTLSNQCQFPILWDNFLPEAKDNHKRALKKYHRELTAWIASQETPAEQPSEANTST
jgi:hypothetical protein